MRSMKVALVAFLLLMLTGGVARLEEEPSQQRRSEAPEYSLEFPTDVFNSPEPLPEPFQPIEVGEPQEAPAEPPPQAPPGDPSPPPGPPP